MKVRGRDASGQMVMRPVQDLDWPEDPDAEVVEAKRAGGRPPKKADAG